MARGREILGQLMERADLLVHVKDPPVVQIVQTGVAPQSDRPLSELTTGEQTLREQIEVTWSSTPTTAQLIEFNRRLPEFAATHK